MIGFRLVLISMSLFLSLGIYAISMMSSAPTSGGPASGGPVTGGPSTGGPATGGPSIGGPVTTPNERCFAETGQCIGGPIRAFWETQGGQFVFGPPISALRPETIAGAVVTVQWFERARLELRDGQVAAGRIGAELLLSHGTDWWTLPKSQPTAGCLFFEATQHTLCEPFLSQWQSHPDSLGVFGQPISEPRWELRGGAEAAPRLTQWFERARFEVVGDVVTQAQIGAELFARRAPLPDSPPAPADQPVPDIVATYQAPPQPPTIPPATPTTNPLDTRGQDIYNCDDFEKWEEARALYEASKPGDPNRLDENGNGIPCEDLPGAP